jgi:hypothetical protein
VASCHQTFEKKKKKKKNWHPREVFGTPGRLLAPKGGFWHPREVLLAPQGGFFGTPGRFFPLSETSNEEKERGLGEWMRMNVIMNV